MFYIHQHSLYYVPTSLGKRKSYTFQMLLIPSNFNNSKVLNVACKQFRTKFFYHSCTCYMDTNVHITFIRTLNTSYISTIKISYKMSYGLHLFDLSNGQYDSLYTHMIYYASMQCLTNNSRRRLIVSLDGIRTKINHFSVFRDSTVKRLFSGLNLQS